MRESQVNQTTFIVHEGTGTIIDADEVTVVNIDNTAIIHEDDVLLYASEQGNTLYTMYVVIVGNIFDGMNVVGPFLNIDEAIEWGDRNGEMDWYTARITPPYTWEGTERIDWEVR